MFEAGRLIYQLARSFDAIRHLPEAEARGFDPIFPPTPSTGATSAPTNPTDPRKSLHTAVRGLRAFGTVFIAAWALMAFIFFVPRPMGFRMQNSDVYFFASSGVVLLAPAALYHLAAFFMPKRELWAATLAMRTAAYQLALVVLGSILFFSTLSLRIPFLGILRAPILVPAVIAVFFSPALAAQLFALTKAIRAIRLLPPAQRGFEMIPLPPQQEDAPAAEPGDSDRFVE